VSIEHDAVSNSVAPVEPGFPWIGLARVIAVGFQLGVFLTGSATDEPGVDPELIMQALK
jgi:hypothetical protein